MNRDIEWQERLEDGRKRKVRINFFAGVIKWQFKIGNEKWDYNQRPSIEDWETLLEKVKARYQYRNVAWKDVELTEKMLKEARRQLTPRQAPAGENTPSEKKEE